MEVVSIESVESIQCCLEKYDNSVPRPLSSRVDNMEDWAKKLYNNAINYEIYDKGKSVGFISFYCNNPNYVYISMIAIDKNQQRRGIGKYLLELVEKKTKETGQRSIRLEVDKTNYQAIMFYEKNGFTKSHSSQKASYSMEKILHELI